MGKKIIFIITVFLLSCGGGNTDTALPEGVLEKEKLIPLIIDLHILEAHFQRQFSRLDLYRDALDSSSFYIFENHGVTKANFSASIDYYATTPDTLFAIYESALDSIQFRLNDMVEQTEEGVINP